MNSTEFNKALAEAWVIEVEGVLETVDKLLEQVAQECQTQPYEDDTIMMTVKQTGDSLHDAWTQLGGIFSNIISETKNIIKSFTEGVAKVVEGFTSAVNAMTH